MTPLAVDQAVPLGVRRKKLFRRKERIEGVDGPVALYATGLDARAHGAVAPVVRGPGGVEGFVIKHITHADTRLVSEAQETEGVLFALGGHRDARRVEAHT